MEMTGNPPVVITGMTGLYIFGWFIGILFDIVFSNILKSPKIDDNLLMIFLVFVIHTMMYMSATYMSWKVFTGTESRLYRSAFTSGLISAQILSFASYKNSITQYYERNKDRKPPAFLKSLF